MMDYRESRVMGIDYGFVRIGIATSDVSKTIAFGKRFIQNNSSALNRITEMVESDNIELIVLGYPLNLKGGKTDQTLEVEKFEKGLKDHLQKKIQYRSIEIVRWDERFTSRIAADSMIASGMKKKNRRDKANIDIISAALLLQSYLDRS
jgi:putative Holliday junction resolvase